MNIGKKVLCILMASMVCIALQFMCSINVYAQETTEDVVTADPLPLTVPAGWTPTPIDEGTIDANMQTTPSSSPVTPVSAPQAPENSTDSSEKDVVTADPLPLTVPAGWTPTPIDEGTIDANIQTTSSPNPVTPVSALQGSENSNDSNENLTDAKIKMPKVEKSQMKNGIITIKWRRVKAASKYQVKIYNEKTGKQVSKKNTKKICFKSKVANAKCSAFSVKVRAYSKSMKKWSRWSKTKVKKVK